MTNRPAGAARSKRWEQAPQAWYVEPEWCVEALFDAIPFGQDLIWDPSCGRGTVLDVAKARGHETFGSDIVDRHARHRFTRGNFTLTQDRIPISKVGQPTSIVNNPPYSDPPGIAEAFMRKACALPVRMAAFVVPIAFLAGSERWRFFTQDVHPSDVLIMSERPTMPPGDKIDEMGARAFKGGMQDYCWIVYRHPHRWATRIRWARPRSKLQLIGREKRLDRQEGRTL